MKSIRSRLLLWILSGAAILIGVTGCCIYFAVRYMIMSQIDDELVQARKVIYNVFENDSLEPRAFVKGAAQGRRLRLRDEERWREFDYKDGELFYQLKDTVGEVLLRSPSLAKRTIEAPEQLPYPRKPVSLELADGSSLRARIDYIDSEKWPLQFHSRMTSDEASLEIIVARDTSETSRTLSYLIAGIWITGIVAMGATALLVSIALRRGLSPLDKFGAQARKVDASHLETRFNDEAMPPELRPICDQLNSLMDRLESSFDRERRFSSDLAHEMRTPIAEVCSLAESAILFPEKVPPGQFDKILATGKRMQGIVESLLALARWEQGSTQLNSETINLAEIVSECWEPFAAAAEEKRLSFQETVSSGSSISTDPDLLRHILNNLLSNAVEYSPEEGFVKLNVLEDAEGSSTGLQISNSIVGMNPSDADHLFERFWRHDEARSDGGHSGLGLSVARACAETLSMDLSARVGDEQICFELSFQQ
tara:strand:- start:99 stop:1541 length:1443 start_codon:yes stop_codon:yes gene_type:complete